MNFSNLISRAKSKQTFTLIELMVVLTVIMILTCLLVPALEKTRALAHKTECKNNMSQIGTLFSFYSADNNGQFPAPYITEFGNYWSNVLYSLYCSDKGLEIDDTAYPTSEPPPYYVDNLAYNILGCKYEEGTVFHCPSAWILQRLNSSTPKTYPLSYSMNPYLAFGSTTSGKPWVYVKTSNILKPSEAYLIMDNNSGMYLGLWQFWSYATRTMTTNIHDEGRNILYVDGHVDYMDNLDFQRNRKGEREPFWFGM